MRVNVISLRNWLADERQVIDATSVTVAENLMALAQVLGMVALPFLPALLVAYALTKDLEGTEITWAIAVVAATGLEAVGITSCKTAMRLYRGFRRGFAGPRELAVSILAVLFYGGLVTAALLIGKHLPGMAGTMGWVSPWLAMTLYVVTGFNIDLQQREDDQARLENEKRQFEHEIALAELKDKTERLRMKREFDMEKARLKLEQQRERLRNPDVAGLARKLYQADPEITGAALGQALGLSARRGQQLKAELDNGRVN